MFIPQTVFMVSGFVSGVPKDMDEAGHCRRMHTLAIVYTCNAATVETNYCYFVYYTICVCMERFSDAVIFDQELRKLTLVLAYIIFMGQFNSEWNMVCAYILVCTLPAVLIYILGQKYIVDGMVAGAVKDREKGVNMDKTDEIYRIFASGWTIIRTLAKRALGKQMARLMKEMGIQVVRMAEFAWQKIEPRKNEFDFEWLDEAIELMGKYEIYTVLGTPTVSSSGMDH